MRLTTFVKLSADCSVPSSPFDNPVSYLWCLKCLPLGKGRVHFTWELYLLLSGRQRRVRASSSYLLHHNCLEFKIIAVPGLSWWSREESPPANAGDVGWVPGLGRSCLLWSSGAHELQLLSLCSRTSEPRAHALKQDKPPQ